MNDNDDNGTHRGESLLTRRDLEPPLDENREIYHYTPFVDPRSQIRLLKFVNYSFRACNHEMIPNWRLEVHDLASKPEYAILSYQWGSRNDGEHELLIDGHSFLVWNNLWSFLTTFWVTFHGLGGEQRYIWIDALCINQSDFSEKASQVSLMGTLYSQAIRTMVWLGTNAGPDLRVMDRTLQYEDPSNVPPYCIDWNTLELDGGLESAYRLAINPYWNRTWIMQEIILSSSIQICAGTEPPMHWDLFALGMKRYTHLLERKLLEGRRAGIDVIKGWKKRTWLHIDLSLGLPVHVQHSQWAFLYEMRNARAAGYVTSYQGLHGLAFWLERASQKTFCQDSRDRVYAILSLLDHSTDSRPIEPNYDISAGELFIEIQRAYWRQREVTSNNFEREATALGVTLRRHNVGVHTLLPICCATGLQFIRREKRLGVIRKTGRHRPGKCRTVGAAAALRNDTGEDSTRCGIPWDMVRVRFASGVRVDPSPGGEEFRVLLPNGRVTMPLTPRQLTNLTEHSPGRTISIVEVDGTETFLLAVSGETRLEHTDINSGNAFLSNASVRISLNADQYPTASELSSAIEVINLPPTISTQTLIGDVLLDPRW